MCILELVFDIVSRRLCGLCLWALGALINSFLLIKNLFIKGPRAVLINIYYPQNLLEPLIFVKKQGPNVFTPIGNKDHKIYCSFPNYVSIYLLYWIMTKLDFTSHFHLKCNLAKYSVGLFENEQVAFKIGLQS